MKRALVVLFGLVLGCAAQARPPPGWQQGGTALFVPRASWNAGWTSVELLSDGRVIVNGVEWFLIDGAGRVLDGDGQPMAVLRSDGRLLGADGEDLGFVGATSAAAPGEDRASSAIAPAGQVLRYDDDGNVATIGAWTGCGYHAQSLQTCMLVTHLVSARFPAQWPGPRSPMTPYGPFAPSAPGMAPGIGIGLGFGVTPP